jgi:hypothetical protein
MPVIAGSKTTVLISFPFNQPFLTFLIPGCPSRTALPTSNHPTTNVLSCREAESGSAQIRVKLSKQIKRTKQTTLMYFILSSPVAPSLYPGQLSNRK